LEQINDERAYLALDGEMEGMLRCVDSTVEEERTKVKLDDKHAQVCLPRSDDIKSTSLTVCHVDGICSILLYYKPITVNP